MKLVNIKRLEDCFDGSLVFRYCFGHKIDEVLMRRLAGRGKLHYYPDFPKPFFKIITQDGVQVKGIIGEDNVEVVYPKTKKEEKKASFDTNLALLSSQEP